MPCRAPPAPLSAHPHLHSASQPRLPCPFSRHTCTARLCCLQPRRFSVNNPMAGNRLSHNAGAVNRQAHVWSSGNIVPAEHAADPSRAGGPNFEAFKKWQCQQQQVQLFSGSPESQVTPCTDASACRTAASAAASCSASGDAARPSPCSTASTLSRTCGKAGRQGGRDSDSSKAQVHAGGTGEHISTDWIIQARNDRGAAHLLPGA